MNFGEALQSFFSEGGLQLTDIVSPNFWTSFAGVPEQDRSNMVGQEWELNFHCKNTGEEGQIVIKRVGPDEFVPKELRVKRGELEGDQVYTWETLMRLENHST